MAVGVVFSLFMFILYPWVNFLDDVYACKNAGWAIEELGDSYTGIIGLISPVVWTAFFYIIFLRRPCNSARLELWAIGASFQTAILMVLQYSASSMPFSAADYLTAFSLTCFPIYTGLILREDRKWKFKLR